MATKATTVAHSRATLRARVLQLAWPAILEMSLHMVTGIVDTAMVGRLGPAAIAAVGMGATLVMGITTVFSAIATGTTALVARHTGAGDLPEAEETARQSLMLAAVTAVIVSTLALSAARQLLGLIFGAAEERVLEFAADYFRIVGLFFPAQAMIIVLNASLRGSGDTRTPMQVTALVNCINVLLNYCLIFGPGPFPALGVAGAATATGVAQALGALTLAYATFGHHPLLNLRPTGLSLRPNIIRRVLRIGLPAAIEQGSMRIAQIAFAVIVAHLGTTAYAAHQIALNAESLSFMPGFGFALAATTLVGQCLGAERREDARSCGHQAAKQALIVMSFMGVVFLVFAEPLIRLFVSDLDTVRQGVICLRIVALAQPFLAWVMVYAGALRGAGDTRSVLVITALSMFGVRLPLAYLLGIHLGLGLAGVWTGMASDLMVRGICLLARFRSGKWQSIEV